jgi:hypothetical protein
MKPNKENIYPVLIAGQWYDVVTYSLPRVSNTPIVPLKLEIIYIMINDYILNKYRIVYILSIIY